MTTPTSRASHARPVLALTGLSRLPLLFLIIIHSYLTPY